MPKVSLIVDWMKIDFPGIKVLWAQEGDYMLGKKPDKSKYCTPNLDYLNDKKVEKKTKKK